MKKRERVLMGIDSTNASAKLEMNYQALLENTGIAIVIVDKDGKYLFANSTAANNLGCDIQNVIGKTMSDFLPPEIAQKYLERNRRLIKTGDGEVYEATFDLPSGAKTFLINDRVLNDEQGNGFAIQSSSIDITERKETEKILAENEEQYRLLIQNLPGTSVFLFDHDLRFILAEGYLHPEFGFTTSQLVGKTLEEVIPKERAEQLVPIYRNALNGRPTENFTSKYKDQHFLVSILPVRNKQGAIHGGMVVSQNITDRKKAEKAKKEIEEKFRCVFEFSNVPHSITSLKGEINVNHAFCEMFGYTEDELKKKKWQELTYHEEIEIDQKLIDLLLKGEKSGVRRVKRYVHKNGSILWGDVSYALIRDSEGNPLYFITTIIDITERKNAEDALRESEEKWHLLVETIPDYIALYDAEGRYLFLNHFAEGFSAKDIEGKYYTDFLSDESKKIYEETFRKAKETKQTQYIDYIAYGNHYSFRNYESFFVPIVENDELVNMLVIARDITERKKNEQILQENELRLRELNATKDKFFSIIAHDLRSPFNSILGLSEFMVSQIQEGNFEKMEEYAAIIKDSSQRAMDLLQNLLEWSRVQTGRMVFSPENLKIDLLIHEALHLLSNTAAQKSIIISRSIPNSLFAFVDKSMFSAVIRNLVSNAIKFSYRGGEIRVELRELNNQIEVSVSDNGIGIKADQLENLFRIDQNQSKPGTQNEKGTGLGLILCKEFVEKHGGKIWVESEPGKGSKFKFIISKI